MSMEPLYPIDESAVKLGGISRHTVVAWLVQGKLRRTKVGRRTMIAESELKRFVQASTDAAQTLDATQTKAA